MLDGQGLKLIEPLRELFKYGLTTEILIWVGELADKGRKETRSAPSAESLASMRNLLGATLSLDQALRSGS
jgi:hypothetical protein